MTPVLLVLILAGGVAAVAGAILARAGNAWMVLAGLALTGGFFLIGAGWHHTESGFTRALGLILPAIIPVLIGTVAGMAYGLVIRNRMRGRG